MLGLVYKDIVNMKKNIVFYLALILLLSGVGVIVDLGMYIVMLCGFLFILPVVQSIREDEKTNWDRYGVCMPVSRNQIALSKYVLSLLGFLLGVSIVALNYIFVDGFMGLFSTDFIVLLIIVEVIYTLIIIPVNLKFGTKYGGGIMIILFYAPMGAFIALQSHGVELPSVSSVIKYLPIGTVALLALSIVSSIHIYGKKDF